MFILVDFVFDLIFSRYLRWLDSDYLTLILIWNVMRGYYVANTGKLTSFIDSIFTHVCLQYLYVWKSVNTISRKWIIKEFHSLHSSQCSQFHSLQWTHHYLCQHVLGGAQAAQWHRGGLPRGLRTLYSSGWWETYSTLTVLTLYHLHPIGMSWCFYPTYVSNLPQMHLIWGFLWHVINGIPLWSFPALCPVMSTAWLNILNVWCIAQIPLCLGIREGLKIAVVP